MITFRTKILPGVVEVTRKEGLTLTCAKSKEIFGPPGDDLRRFMASIPLRNLSPYLLELSKPLQNETILSLMLLTEVALQVFPRSLKVVSILALR